MGRGVTPQQYTKSTLHQCRSGQLAHVRVCAKLPPYAAGIPNPECPARGSCRVSFHDLGHRTDCAISVVLAWSALLPEHAPLFCTEGGRTGRNTFGRRAPGISRSPTRCKQSLSPKRFCSHFVLDATFVPLLTRHKSDRQMGHVGGPVKWHS